MPTFTCDSVYHVYLGSGWGRDRDQAGVKMDPRRGTFCRGKTRVDGSTCARARARAGWGGGHVCCAEAIHERTTCPVSWHTCCPTWLLACACFFSGVMAAAPRVTCMQRSAAPLQQQSKPNNKYSLESKMFAVGHTMSNAPDLF